MSAFVRKNILSLTAKFTPPNYIPPGGWQNWTPPPQPTTVIASIRYPVTVNPRQYATVQIALAIQADGVTWLGQWDSSASLEGTVQWVIFASGNNIQSAQQGVLEIVANQANTF